MTRDHSKRVFAAQDDDALRKLVAELMTSATMKKEGRVLDSGRTWEVLHRCLTDGELDPSGGEFPLNHVFLGAKNLHQGDDYTAVLIRPDICPFIAEALGDMKLTDLRQKFDALGPSYTGGRTEKDFAEAWRVLQRLRTFFEDCAQNRDAVLFTIDGNAAQQARSA